MCYCPGDCFLPSSWEKLLGTFEMTPATFSWTTAETKVYRKAGGPTGSLELTVKRPPFGSYSNVEDWELKVVKKHFDCSVVRAGALAETTGASLRFPPPPPHLSHLCCVVRR